MKKTILIADDEIEMSFTISLILARNGYETLTASNGHEALQMIEKRRLDGKRIDLIICDILMPEMNGEELIEKLNQDKYQTPILAITGYRTRDLIINLRHNGCNDFIDKPFLMKELEDHVEKLLIESHTKTIEMARQNNQVKIGDKYAASVHDLNNILTCAKEYNELALIESKSSLYPIREHMRKALNSTEQAEELCKKLLNKKEDNNSTLTLTEIHPVIQGIIDCLNGIIPESINFRTLIIDKPVFQKIDPGQLKRAIINLCINSIQAMPTGGTLTLTVNYCDSALKIDDAFQHCLSITIDDTGCGISSENLYKISTGSFSTKPKGLGIGLQSVKAIMQQHKGLIDIKSELGKGTIVQLLFPAN